MKELSIEDKAKRYDEAAKWMEGIYPTLTHEQQMEAEAFFPELKESEDEKIRKMLIEFFGWGAKNNCYTYNIPNKDILAWLEKQGQTYTKKDVDDAYLKGVTDTKKEIEKQYEANYQIRKNIATFLFYYRGDIKDRAKWMDYLGIKVSFFEKQGEPKPQGKSALEAIKEERVDNANKVEPKDYNSIDPHYFKPTDNVEPQPAWSEEDEDNMYHTLINLTELKDKYGEEYGNVGKCIEWLKSFRHQNTWKPSDKQMASITCAIRKMKESACYDSELVSLLNDLKKLKE